MLQCRVCARIRNLLARLCPCLFPPRPHSQTPSSDKAMMELFSLLIWLVYGIMVGGLAKLCFPSAEGPNGFLGTLVIGIAGSFVGGFASWVLGYGGDPLQSSGLVMGVLGAVLALALYKYLKPTA